MVQIVQPREQEILKSKVQSSSISLLKAPETGAKQKIFPGGIHQPKAIQFWSSELKANQWVLEVLENGYVIPFEK